MFWVKANKKNGSIDDFYDTIKRLIVVVKSTRFQKNKKKISPYNFICCKGIFF
jgi:hypothetical protein